MSECKNRTGFKGVVEHKQRDGSPSGRYHGQFNYHGVPHWTPTFSSPEEASAALHELYEETTNERF